jgi:hypothetical protein
MATHSHIPVLPVTGIVLAVLLGLGDTVQAHPPTLTAIPGSGPAGTLVLLKPLNNPPVKSIEICLKKQPCKLVPFKGMSPVVFAIPKGLTPNAYDITVTYKERPNEQYSPDTSQFTVVDGPRHVSIDSFDLGINRLTDGTPMGLQLLLFGSGFDLANDILIDGKKYSTSIPGIDHQGLELTTPLDQALPEMCGTTNCVESVRRVVVEPSDVGTGKHHIELLGQGATDPPLAGLDVTFPQLPLLVKFDRVEQHNPRLTPEWLPLLVSRADALASLGQVFTTLGYRLDLWQGEPPRGFDLLRGSDFDCYEHKATPGMELDDVIDFARAAGSRPTGVSQDSWYIHASVLTHLVPVSGFRALGAYLTGLVGTKLNHAEIAIFSRSVCDELSLRTLMHEVGHALGLTHCDGDSDGLTLMNQTQCLDEDRWQFNFSPRASTALSAVSSRSLQPQPTSSASSSQEQTVGDCCLRLQKSSQSLTDLSQLEFTLAAPEGEIVSGETVRLTVKFTNHGEVPVKILPFFDPSYSFAIYFIQKIDQDSSPRSRLVPFLSFDGQAESQSIASGYSFKGDAVVSASAEGYVFTPGKYKIQGFFHGILSSLGEPAGEVASNVLTLDVRAPQTGAENELAKLLLDPETRMFLLAHGGETYGDLPKKLEAAVREASNVKPSRLMQEAAFVLSEYYNRSGNTMADTTRAADYKKALNFLELVARGPKLSESSDIRFHTERALALGALRDARYKEELRYLEELPSDIRARQGLERVHHILDTVGETNLDVDLRALRADLGQFCENGDWMIENKPTARTEGIVAQLATAPILYAQGVRGLTLLGENSTEALFAIGMTAPEGLTVKSSALQLRVKVKQFKTALSLERLPLPDDLSGASIEVPLQFPCFLSGAVKGLNLPGELDAQSIERIRQWDKKGRLFLDLKTTLPADLTRLGGKIGGPVAISPP